MERTFSIACLAITFGLLTNNTFAGDTPPNWKLFAAGTTVGPGDGSVGPDVDEFAGFSTHLGKFTGGGEHFLDIDTLEFAGSAIYTAANGDQIFVEYTGGVTGVDPDPEAAFPFLIEGEFEIVGGTGRLANAEGNAQMTGAFTGVPGELFFNLEGTLHPQGK